VAVEVLDTLGQKSPQPVLKIAVKAPDMKHADILEILGDCPRPLRKMCAPERIKGKTRRGSGYSFRKHTSGQEASTPHEMPMPWQWRHARRAAHKRLSCGKGTSKSEKESKMLGMLSM